MNAYRYCSLSAPENLNSKVIAPLRQYSIKPSILVDCSVLFSRFGNFMKILSVASEAESEPKEVQENSSFWMGIFTDTIDN